MSAIPWIYYPTHQITVIIAISIPLSILTSVIVLSLLNETINIMTLGGLPWLSASSSTMRP